MTFSNCKLSPDLDSLQRRGLVTPDEADDLAKRIAHLDAMLSATKVPVNSQLSSLSAELQNEALSLVHEVQTLVNATNSRPLTGNWYRSMENWLGRQFGGLFQTPLNLRARFTPEEALSLSSRMGRGRVHNILASMQLVGDISDAQRTLRPLKDIYGLTEDAYNRFMLDAYEIGFHGQLQLGYGLGPHGIEVLRQRQLAFLEHMDELGISQAHRQLIEQTVLSVSSKYEQALQVARRLNIDVNDSSQLQRYMPRIFSRDADVRIQWKRDGSDIDWTSATGSRTRSDFSNSFTMSRRSNFYIVEDEVVLDAILRADNPDVYVQLEVADITDLLDDQRKLSEAFFRPLPDGSRVLTDQTLNILVENGLISKLPMTGNELFDYMKVNYELPFEELNELFVTDWRKAAEIYRRQLEDLSGNSMLTQALASAAREQGWGIDAATRRANPEEFRHFVPLIGNDAIPPRIAERFGIDPKTYGQVYVHPAAAQLYRGMMDLTTSPTGMGALGNVFEVFNTAFTRLGLDKVTQIFRTQALTSTRFIFGQLYGASLQLWASGGDLAAFGTDILRTMRVTAETLSTGRPFQEVILNTLDDARPLYKVPGQTDLLTERQLWEWGRATGVINEYVIPWARVTENAPPSTLTDAGLLGWANRTRQYVANAATSDAPLLERMQRAFGQTWRSTFEIPNDALGNSVGFFAEVFDNTARLNLLRAITLTTDRTVPGVRWKEARRFLSTQDLGRIQNSQRELYRYVQSYFYTYDNVGIVDKQMSRYVVPFWGFLSRNVVGQTRMLFRRPSRFANWNRLLAAVNQHQVADEDLPVAAIPQWVYGDRSNIYWSYEDEDGEQEYVVFSARGWDSLNEGVNPIATAGDTLLRRIGMWGPSSQIAYQHPSTRLDEFPWERDDRSAVVQAAFSQLYPQWSILGSSITGTDLARDIPLDGSQEYLGVNMPTWLVYTLRNSIPLSNQLNIANPGGIFGRAAQVDYATGQVVDNGELSWARVERNRSRAVSDYRNWWERVQAATRLAPIQIDVARNSGQTESEMFFSLQQGEKYLQRRVEGILSNRGMTSEQLQRELDQLKVEAMQLAYLDMEYRALRQWRERQGFTPPYGARQNAQRGAFDFINQELSEEAQYDSIERYVLDTLEEASRYGR